MVKLIDDKGLSYFLQKLDGRFVAIVAGKGLSAEDFTSALKSKLENIEANAEVNDISQITIDGSPVPVSDKIAKIDLSSFAKKSEIVAVFRYKGTCTWAELIAKADAEVGDTWNVSDKGGMNYTCKTAHTAGENSWDASGSTVDLSPYLTKTEAGTTYAVISHKHVISDITGLTEALAGKTDSDTVISLISQNMKPMTNEEIDSIFV